MIHSFTNNSILLFRNSYIRLCGCFEEALNRITARSNKGAAINNKNIANISKLGVQLFKFFVRFSVRTVILINDHRPITLTAIFGVFYFIFSD